MISIDSNSLSIVAQYCSDDELHLLANDEDPKIWAIKEVSKKELTIRYLGRSITIDGLSHEWQRINLTDNSAAKGDARILFVLLLLRNQDFLNFDDISKGQMFSNLDLTQREGIEILKRMGKEAGYTSETGESLFSCLSRYLKNSSVFKNDGLSISGYYARLLGWYILSKKNGYLIFDDKDIHISDSEAECIAHAISYVANFRSIVISKASLSDEALSLLRSFAQISASDSCSRAGKIASKLAFWLSIIYFLSSFIAALTIQEAFGQSIQGLIFSTTFSSLIPFVISPIVRRIDKLRSYYCR
jgi:hypothetical protein